jgi:patatin-related protein
MPDVRELRLALVCYGGVSLAVYMHGVTKEIHKLVKASRALAAEAEGEPPPRLVDSEEAYAEALKRAGAGGARLDVVVDIVSGTSAGGINGIVLAKALAGNLPQDRLRDVWLEDADIRRLARGWKRLPYQARLLFGGLSAALRPNGRPPLDEDYMLDRIFAVLEDMTGSTPRAGEHQTLMPKGHELELHVTATDFGGARRYLQIHEPRYDQAAGTPGPYQLEERQHRHVLVFRQTEPGENSAFRDDAALAFAARATSSFPGAFAPVRPGDVERAGRKWPEDWIGRYFRTYELAGEERIEASFVDGGVLNNKPFDHAIAAILAKPAWHQVDRRLVFIEPHPQTPEPPKAEQPGWWRTVLGTLSGIPSYEPIAADLLQVRQLNERVRRIGILVRAAEPRIDAILQDVAGGVRLAKLPAERIHALGEQVNNRARLDASLGYDGYVDLKLMAVVEGLASALNCVLRYPPESDHASFVADALWAWARDEEYVADAGDRLAREDAGRIGRVIDFLKAVDIGYSRRRLRFVVDGLNDWYPRPARDGEGAAAPAPVPRDELDRVKGALYRLISEMDAVLAGRLDGSGAAPEDLVAGAAKVFDASAIRDAMRRRRPPSEFVSERREAIVGLEAELREWFASIATERHRRLAEIFESTMGWDAMVREDLVARYLGFAYWDVLTYPIMAMRSLGEFDPVEVVRISPEDATALITRSEGGKSLTESKLRGVAIGHFGAFFERSARENDYLWGRLDAAERLLDIVEDVSGQRGLAAECRPAAIRAILDAERPHLPSVAGRIDELRCQLARRALESPPAGRQ